MRLSTENPAGTVLAIVGLLWVAVGVALPLMGLPG